MKLHELLPKEEYKKSTISIDKEIEGITTSPTEVQSNYLFISENANHMPQASSFKTTPLAIVTDDESAVPNGIPYVLTKNARKASATIHSNFWGIDYSGLKIIGVTGTNGKTTTSYIIYKIILENLGNCGFIGSGLIEINGKKVSDETYSMTTPDISKLYKIIKKMQDEGCGFIIMEVSSHALSLNKVSAIPFEYGVFTNLSHEHTDFHDSMDNYFNAKMVLLKSAKRVVLNIDDFYAREALNEFNGNVITAGVLWQGDYYATHVESKGFNGTTYYIHTDKICYKTTIRFPGVYNVYNTLLASAVCIDLKIPPCGVKKTIANIQKIKGRFDVITDSVKVIIDYAHTPKAYESFLQSLYSIKGTSNLTVVFGCGGDRDKSKRPLIADIVEKYADKIIITEDNSRKEALEDILNDIKDGFTTLKYEIIPDRSKAIKKAVLNSKENDIVAIIGKGCEEYNIKGEVYSPYNDKIEAANALYEYKERMKNEN